MHTDNIYLVGAGGHCKVVLDALLEDGVSPSRFHICDEAPHLHGREFLDYRIETPLPVDKMAKSYFHLAIGEIEVRRRLFAALTERGALPLTVVHPSASVSRYSVLGASCFVAARSVIAPAAILGDSVISNHGAIIDHDCEVGDFSHIAPNVTLGGGVKVAAGVFIGAGAIILPGIRIGAGATIGAGAVVTEDVDAGETRVGIPARKIVRG